MHSGDATQRISRRARGREAGGSLNEGAMAQREHDEFDALETEHPQGISAGQIVEFFAPRGTPLAQATFRKYVQLGLLPRSRRVGEKGKHRGSHGLYPAAAARRIHLIKSLMDEGMTLEEIRSSTASSARSRSCSPRWRSRSPTREICARRGARSWSGSSPKRGVTRSSWS